MYDNTATTASTPASTPTGLSPRTIRRIELHGLIDTARGRANLEESLRDKVAEFLHAARSCLEKTEAHFNERQDKLRKATETLAKLEAELAALEPHPDDRFIQPWPKEEVVSC